MPHFVVYGPGQKRKAGIIASNYKEFLRKCRKKFGYKVSEVGRKSRGGENVIKILELIFVFLVYFFAYE